MAFGSGSSGGLRNDINITPLVDVVLVLLIIFMVVTPMLRQGKPVDLPKAKMAESEDLASSLVVSVTAQREIFVEDNLVELSELEKRVQLALRQHKERRVLLKGDAALQVGDVRVVMDAIKRAGSNGVSLAVRDINGGTASAAPRGAK